MKILNVVQDEDFCDELYGMTQAWSKYNDNIYIIANQLLSLTFAHKYFGSTASRDVLLRVCELFFAELDALGHRLENRTNFCFDRVYQVLMDILVVNKSADADDVLVEENISDIYRICPITRKPITQPVSQV